MHGIIDDFTRLGGIGLTLTGGEVLTHPGWFEILAFACEHPALKEVCLQTNAMLVSRHVATAFHTLYDKMGNISAIE